MDAFCDPSVKEIVGVFSAQMAKSTAIENAIGYFSHRDPAPIMWVLPTLDIAEAMSKDRLAPMIRDTPCLKERFAESGSKTSGDTLLHKKFPGGAVTLAGANSFNSLASRPIRIVIGDEASKWKPNEKGSPFRQVVARVRAFWNSKVAFFSTPTDSRPENEFWQLWEQSDKRLYYVPCPHCGERVVFTFDELPASLPADIEAQRAVLRWTESDGYRTEDGRTIRRASAAWFECLGCGGKIDDNERHRAVQRGEWRPSQAFNGTAGFWGWTAMSPFCSAEFIANEWLGALGSQQSLQSVKNETLGLPWAEQGEAPEWKRLFDRREQDRRLGEIPPWVLFLTAGVDVQQDRLEVQVIGWGRRRVHAVVDYIVIDGDTSRPQVWRDLTTALGTLYRHPAGTDLAIRKLAVDSGYETQRVYEWARAHRFGRVAVVKGGSDTQTAPVSAASAVEITVGGRKMDAGVKIHTLNVGHFKSELYGLLRLETPNVERGEEYPDGWLSIPQMGDTEEYCRQLTAEQLVTRKVKGYYRRHWEKSRPRNEALDTWVYARAAAQMCGIDRMQEADWAGLEISLGIASAPASDAAPAPEPQAQPVQRSSGGGWFSGGRPRGGWFSR